MISNNIKKIIFISLIIFMNLSLSYAEQGRRTPSRDGVLTAGPYYNPASKSYFELLKVPKITDLTRWRHLKIHAGEKFLKKTQGQLATVKNLATHQFIIRHFSAPQPFWIGLEYVCKTRQLKWVDDSYLTQASFSAWAIKWHRIPSYGCHNVLHVSYTRDTPTKASQWQAVNSEKRYDYFLVEYPTGKE